MILLATGLYWIVLGTLALVASTLVAQALRRRGRQERGAWATGLGAAVLLPLLVPLLGAPDVSGATAPSSGIAGTVIDLTPVRVDVAEAAGTAWVEPVLLGIWGVVSLLLLVRLLASLQVVARIRRAAEPVAPGVRVSEGHGPAVVGLLRPEILVPAWIIDLPEGERSWILRHETEHIRGRDPLLVGFLIAARVALPWNPVVWAFGAALRSAIETDCDRRTLGPAGDARSYGEALLRVARGARDSARLPAMAPAFAEQSVPLDHRIEALTRPRRRLGRILPLAITAVVIATTVAACEVPAPTAAPTEAPTPPLPPTSASIQAEGAPPAELDEPVKLDEPAKPTFIPYDVPPRLNNAAEVQAALAEEYPPMLFEAGIGGTANVWLFVDEEGRVSDVELNEGSALEALDQAALRVARMMSFTPAMNRDRPTSVWVSIPITFTTSR